MERNELAEKMELIGQVFEIDGMTELLGKFDSKAINTVKFNAIVIQISALLLKSNPDLAEKIIALDPEIEDAKALDDADFAIALRNSITRDVLGFFASSRRTDGKK